MQYDRDVKSSGVPSGPEEMLTWGPQSRKGMAQGLTLLTIKTRKGYALGAKTSRGILNVPEAARLMNAIAPSTMDELLANEDGPRLNALVERALVSAEVHPAIYSEIDVQFGPVVVRPQKIVCVGLNYGRHAAEVGKPIPTRPVLFSKFSSSLSAHLDTIKLPLSVATKFDYEVELVAVIGKKAVGVSEADALSYVAGYCVGNDLSARDLQLEFNGGQWMLGKSLDHFAPVGPYLITADQVDVSDLKIDCRVNGDVRQSSRTSDMIFNVAHLVSYISQHITLEPGDLIFTGTPEGVIQGRPAQRQVWLKPGDTLECCIEKLGELRFRFA
jgi:2-keto-4-pentenoate hydratase/2-oxohepta-3-ene-1,7-dioic acid hydratase in catechol pathway